MNRIILIGNGFDLAHGLKTSYKHFIDWFWKNEITFFNQHCEPYSNQQYEDDYISIKDFQYWMTATVFSNENDNRNPYAIFREQLANGHYRGNLFFKNKFLETITQKAHLQNWVDIEEEYFEQLKYIIYNLNNPMSSKYVYMDKTEDIIENNQKVKKTVTAIEQLNNDFKQIKIDLEDYLDKNCRGGIQRNGYILNQISSRFDYEHFTKKGKVELKDYQQKKYFPDSFLILNFNYTTSEETYRGGIKDFKPVEIVHIHGIIRSDYPIIFGYGDEQDEIHKELEKCGGDYLENVKTINYLKTPNYKNLLNFIESGMYQILIMGHSCGLSDKTLLNTLFEHKNCVSIKPFYYIDENGHNNYDDTVKNIYRCFTNKALMRNKVVNLKYCNELSK